MLKSIKIPQELHERLRQAALDRREKIYVTVTEILTEWLKKHEGKKK